MDVLSLLQAGFNGAKRDQENHRQSKREKKKTQSSKGQKQARTRSVAGVLYSALVYNCWRCCSGQLQILLLQLLLLLVLVLLLLLLQWQQTKSHVKKSAACGDMHGNWGACSKCKQRVPKLFLFFLPLQFSFCVTQKFIIIFFLFFSKMGLHKNYKVSIFPLQFNLIFSSGGFLFFIFINLNK